MDEERKAQLRKTLEEYHTWPSVYMYKFVLPNDQKEKAIKLRQIFGEASEFRERLSSKGTYLSITIREVMLDVDTIFERYAEVNKLGGILTI